MGRRATVAARHQALKPASGLAMHEAGGGIGICKGKAKPAMRDSRWPVWFHHSCCHSHSRLSAASIARMPKSAAQRGGWCPRRRRATWSAEGRLGEVPVLRQATVAANSATNSFLYEYLSPSIVRWWLSPVVCHPSRSVPLSLDAQPSPRCAGFGSLARLNIPEAGHEMKRGPSGLSWWMGGVLRGSRCCCVSSPSVCAGKEQAVTRGTGDSTLQSWTLSPLCECGGSHGLAVASLHRAQPRLHSPSQGAEARSHFP